jgi:hypothetical protein
MKLVVAIAIDLDVVRFLSSSSLFLFAVTSLALLRDLHSP